MGALLCRKVEELESVLDLLESTKEHPFLLADSFRFKLSFLKSLHAAEVGSGAADADSARLGLIADRISALDAIFSTETPEVTASEDTKPALSMENIVFRKNSEELESMQDPDLLDPAETKIRSRIGFPKSLLPTESKNICHMASRLAALEAALNESSPCSCTSLCFDQLEKENEGGEDGNSAYSGDNGEGDMSSMESQKNEKDCTSETAVSLESIERDGKEKRGFRCLRAVGAVVGALAVAAMAMAVGSFYGAGETFYLVPT